MKTNAFIIVFIAVMLISATAYPQQGVAINTTGATPHASAMLDVSSNSKGMLIPRLDNGQITSMPNPANGLLVFNTDYNCFYYYISTGPSSGAWRQLIDNSNNYTLYDVDGDSYLTLNYEGGDDDTLRIYFDDIEKYKITSRAIEQLSNGESVFMGEGAGKNDDGTFNHNTFIGYRSGYQTVNTTANTGVGYYTLSENTGSSNTAFGSSALRLNSTGGYNTAVGTGSQMNGASGSGNTSAGYMSLMYSRGAKNIAIGYRALMLDTAGAFNTAVGSESMYNNGNGTFNSSIGYRSLYNNTTGSSGIAIGYNSSFANLTGANNIAIGSHSLYLNETSSYNIAIGTGALYDLGTGTENVAIGTSSMNMADIGSYNTSVGTWTLYSNKEGSANTTMGHYAMALDSSGSYNNAMGYYALYGNKTGHSNVAIGPFALFFNTTSGNLVAIGDSALYNNGTNASEPAHASKNVAIGSKALYANTTGRSNTAIGFEAMKNTTTGVDNLAAGAYALFTNTSGGGNTAGGYYALYLNSEGYENSAFGYHALEDNNGNYNSAFGTFALMNNNVNGNQNTAMGCYSLSMVTTGDNNTALGYEAATYGNHTQGTFIGSKINISTARTNVSVLGYGVLDAQCTNNNQVLLGNTAIGQIRAQVSSITVYSDGRFKNNISENVPGLEFIKRLRPVTYNENPEILHQIWGTPASALSAIDHSEIKQQRFIGFVAQDVEKAAKECGFEFPGIDIPRNDREVYSLRYGDFIMPMVKAIQEQQAMIEKLQKKIEELEAKVGK